MKKAILSSVLTILFITLCFTFTGCESDSSTNPTLLAPNALFVANFSDHAGNLSMVNLETSEVSVGIEGLGDNPNDILFRDNRLYIINSLSNSLDILGFDETKNLSDWNG